MVKVPLQNNKNWGSSKCLVKKSEKMYLLQNHGMWNSKIDTFGAVMYLSFTYTVFLIGVSNMGGAPQNLMREVFEKNRKMRGLSPPPPTMGNPDISRYTRKYLNGNNFRGFCGFRTKSRKFVPAKCLDLSKPRKLIPAKFFFKKSDF